METTRRWTLAVVGVMLLAAACGGGGTDGGGGDGGAAAEPGAAASIDVGGALPSDVALPSLPEVSLPALEGGDPASADVCGLVTAAEVEGVFGVSGVTQGFYPGPPDTCDYQLDSAPFVTIVLNTTGSSFVFDAMAADGNSTTVGGIGDKALYNSQQLVFLVLKGDKLISVSAYDPTKTDEERAALLKEIGKIAAGRM